MSEVWKLSGKQQNKIPEEFRDSSPDLEWRKITGMRDRLVHDYFGIDYTIVWDVAVNKLGSLKKGLESILSELK